MGTSGTLRPACFQRDAGDARIERGATERARSTRVMKHYQASECPGQVPYRRRRQIGAYLR